MEKETWTSSEICEKNWWTCFRLRMRGRLCEIRSCEVGNLRNIHQRGGGGRWDAPTRIPYVYRVIVRARWREGKGGDI